MVVAALDSQSIVSFCERVCQFFFFSTMCIYDGVDGVAGRCGGGGGGGCVGQSQLFYFVSGSANQNVFSLSICVCVVASTGRLVVVALACRRCLFRERVPAAKEMVFVTKLRCRGGWKGDGDG